MTGSRSSSAKPKVCAGESLVAAIDLAENRHLVMFVCIRGFVRWLGRDATIGEVSSALDLRLDLVVLSIMTAEKVEPGCGIGFLADMDYPVASWPVWHVKARDPAEAGA